MKRLEMPPALVFIRKNVPLKRVKEIEKELEDWSMFDNQITETVYRAYKGSFKIQYAQSISCDLIGLICYLLSGKRLKYAGDNRKFIKGAEKVFKKGSTFISLTKRYLSLPVGKKAKSGWIYIDECLFPLLGGELFYYCILVSLLKVAKKALKNKKYSYEIMNWNEAICEYVLYSVRK